MWGPIEIITEDMVLISFSDAEKVLGRVCSRRPHCFTFLGGSSAILSPHASF